MTTIKEEIGQYLEMTVTPQGATAASFRFPPEFIGFRGHFPTRSILPGACQIQCLMSLLERHYGKTLALREIVLAKYMFPILPDEEILCALVDAVDSVGKEFTARAFMTRNGERVAELRLRVSGEG